MRAAKTFSLALILTACATPGDLAQERAQLRAGADDAYDIAVSLVTEVGPRFAGSEGDARAVQWAQRKFRELGFANVRAEPVTVPHWDRGSIAIEMLAPRSRALEAVALGGSVATPPGGIEARVVMVTSFEALEALPAAQVNDRIVFINGRMQRTADGSGYGQAAPMRRKGPAVAGAKGAKAVLIRSLGTDLQAHTGTTKYETSRKVPAAALSGPSADALELAFLAGPVRVRMSLNSRELPERQSANVIGEIPGKSDEIVLLGAHLDSWDITPGANDDAAGVGIVMAAARRIAALGKPRQTIRVVLFANEEFGASGAKAYAQAHAAEVGRHVLVMEADSGGGRALRLGGGVTDPDYAWVTELASQLGLEPAGNGKEGGTDVEPMRELGVPELQVGQDGSKYFDVHHTRGDTVDVLDREGMAHATGAIAAVAHAAMRRPQRLASIPPVKK